MLWIIGVIVAVILLFAVLKYQHFHVKISNFIVLFIMLFFLLSAGYVYISRSPDLSTFDGVVAFLKYYTTWVGAVFGNTGKIAGYAVNQDWKPGLNLTNLNTP